ncbi:uncharacterized protein N7500_010719 [Penicillium coprophilum]|uniref:uncharacterized protein n=1 Tax=Penicillium coprophilum TaxID=36646 RepID=UPI00239BB6C8|nr:uncharacterized protein N7500_010719 [Penicillium coprophilum]KAJ5150530.1 hypothetical protein N7500_010719 [Penicillium coprophilum]
MMVYIEYPTKMYAALNTSGCSIEERGAIDPNKDFTYAASVEFSYVPPWWSLIEKPSFWVKGIED